MSVIIDKLSMSRKPKAVVPPEAAEALAELGKRLRQARLRRNLTLEDVASRLGIHRETLSLVERGSLSASLSTVAGALWIFGLLADLDEVAAPGRDEIGQSLEAIQSRQRARPGHGGMDNDF